MSFLACTKHSVSFLTFEWFRCVIYLCPTSSRMFCANEQLFSVCFFCHKCSTMFVLSVVFHVGFQVPFLPD